MLDESKRTVVLFEGFFLTWMTETMHLLFSLSVREDMQCFTPRTTFGKD